MENIGWGKRRVDMGMVTFSFLCSFLSAVTLSIITILATISINFHFIAFIVFGFYYFIFYVLFAIPIQLVLNLTPRKHNLKNLLIYLLGSVVVTALAIIVLFDEFPFTTIGYYLISIFGSLVFWFFDSMLLQKDNR